MYSKLLYDYLCYIASKSISNEKVNEQIAQNFFYLFSLDTFDLLDLLETVTETYK